MVRIFFILFLFFIPVFATEIDVAVELDKTEPIYEGETFRGLISITHPKDSSLSGIEVYLEEKPLRVERIKTIPLNEIVSMTLFQFSYEAKKAGSYFFPPVTVKIENKTYKSDPVAYEVLEAGPSLTPTEMKQFLSITPLFEGKKPLYPGNRARLGYRYLYRGDLKLTKEKLPFFNDKRLIKLGNAESKEGKEGDFNFLEVWQEIEAEDPGTYTFPPALLEGLVTTGIQKVPKRFKIESEPFVLEIRPFPEEGRPAFFNGAAGSFTITTTLFQDTETAEDQIGIELSISGDGNLNRVLLPNICCQPGWSGEFIITKITPPFAKDNKKTWKLYLKRALNSKEIPSVFFAYFDLHLLSYKIVKTQPIQLREAAFIPPIPLVSSQLPPLEVEKVTFLPPSYLRSVISRTAKGFLLLPASALTFRFKKIIGTCFILFALLLIIFPLNSPYSSLQKLESPPQNEAVEIRQKSINDSLNRLLESEHSFFAAPETPIWISKCFSLLGEHAFATLWQEKALVKMPRFSLDRQISCPEIRAAFSLFAFLALLFFRKSFIFRLFFSLAFICLIYLSAKFYLTPIRAVLVQASFLYPDKNSSTPLFNQPLVAGSVVDLLDNEEGKLLKIGSQDGMVGFIPKNKVRLI